MKRAISLILTVMMFLSLTTAAALADNIETVTVAFLAFTPPSETATKAVEDAMNEILNPQGLAIDLLIMDPASYGQQIPLMLAGGEKVDAFSCLGMSFTSMANSGYMFDLEEDGLLETYGQGIIETMGEFIDGCRVGGVLYGLPQQRDYASPNGWAIIGEYLDAIGYEYDAGSVNHITAEELEDIFARLHAQYPEKDVIVCQGVARTSIINDYPGGDWYGVLMSPSESLELTDLFETPEYLAYCQQFYDWNKKGYISADALTDTNGSFALVSSGKAMAYQVGLKPGMALQESTSNGKATIMFQIEDEYVLASGTFAQMPWCINSNTFVPEATMKVLNLLYTDATLETLLCYGVEGKDYVIDPDGFLNYPEDTTDIFHPNVLPFMQNEFLTPVWAGNSATVWEETKAMNEGAILSLANGFGFDNTVVSTELTALNNVYEEYRYQLEYGFIDPAAGITEMVNKMKAVGLDKYIAEKQAQLNNWAESTK